MTLAAPLDSEEGDTGVLKHIIQISKINNACKRKQYSQILGQLNRRIKVLTNAKHNRTMHKISILLTESSNFVTINPLTTLPPVPVVIAMTPVNQISTACDGCHLSDHTKHDCNVTSLLERRPRSAIVCNATHQSTRNEINTAKVH